MRNPQSVSEQLVETFNRIHLENMQGIPILNPAIGIEAVGFQEYEGRVLGVIITPWLMNVVLLPRDGEDWTNMELGHKQPHEFGSRVYKFMINEYEGIGICQTHSLHSPMRNFTSHEQALLAAQESLDELFEERELSEEEKVDDDLLGKVMRGEDTPEVNLDDFDEIRPYQPGGLSNTVGQQATQVKVEKKISRRNLLRGNFR